MWAWHRDAESVLNPPPPALVDSVVCPCSRSCRPHTPTSVRLTLVQTHFLPRHCSSWSLSLNSGSSGYTSFQYGLFVLFFSSNTAQVLGRAKQKEWMKKLSVPETLVEQQKPAEGKILKPLRFRLLSSKRNEQQTQCLYSPAFSSLHGSRWDVSTWGQAEWYVEGRGLAPEGPEPTKGWHCVEKVLLHNVWKH